MVFEPLWHTAELQLIFSQWTPTALGKAGLSRKAQATGRMGAVRSRSRKAIKGWRHARRQGLHRRKLWQFLAQQVRCPRKYSTSLDRHHLWPFAVTGVERSGRRCNGTIYICSLTVGEGGDGLAGGWVFQGARSTSNCVNLLACETESRWSASAKANEWCCVRCAFCSREPGVSSIPAAPPPSPRLRAVSSRTIDPESTRSGERRRQRRRAGCRHPARRRLQAAEPRSRRDRSDRKHCLGGGRVGAALRDTAASGTNKEQRGYTSKPVVAS
eukprot:SAG31_NODE_778_length_12161_cov_101.601807_1_plen_271_part_00